MTGWTAVICFTRSFGDIIKQLDWFYRRYINGYINVAIINIFILTIDQIYFSYWNKASVIRLYDLMSGSHHAI